MQFARFLRYCKGGVAPLLALGAIPLVASVGTAVDYSRAGSVRSAMQTIGTSLAKLHLSK
jgi:Flp pilus assembly protein TadG